MWIRKKEVSELSGGIRSAIDGEGFDPRDNREGAWSILKNDIYTLIHLEQERKHAAIEEKEHLAQYLSDVVQRGLENVLDNGGDISAQIELTNQIVDLI